nr:WGR domain-containing protein [Rhizobium sp. Leaf383]
MARFYALSIETTLFGEVALVRSWGRVGTHGKRLTHHFTQRHDAEALMQDLLRQKRRRGYTDLH